MVIFEPWIGTMYMETHQQLRDEIDDGNHVLVCIKITDEFEAIDPQKQDILKLFIKSRDKSYIWVVAKERFKIFILVKFL